MTSRLWEVGRNIDGEGFTMGKVDNLGDDEGKGDTGFDVVDMVEGHTVQEVIAVAWVGSHGGHRGWQW